MNPCGWFRRVVLCCRQGEDAAPPRVMVFASSQEAAAAAAQPLRNVLWGQHNISVLLPEGEEPIKVGRVSCLLGKTRSGIKQAQILLPWPQSTRVPPGPCCFHVSSGFGGHQNGRMLLCSADICAFPAWYCLQGMGLCRYFCLN